MAPGWERGAPIYAFVDLLMSELNCLIYDLEIRRCIPDRDGRREEGFEYCAGWDDHKHMGIACLCVWDCQENLPLVFGEENLDKFADLVAKRKALMVSFNGMKFDNAVIATYGIEIFPARCYDLLREMWAADGLAPDHFSKDHSGYGLDACAAANFQDRKTGNGADAPKWWQRGRVSDVITYCLKDVMLTRRLFLRVVNNGGVVVHPKRAPQTMKLRVPIV